MKFFCVSLVLCIGLFNLQAQRFLHFTSNDGLPDNHVRFTYQDSNGYIYIGTHNGFSRYDGYIFSPAVVEDTAGFMPKDFSAMTESEYGYFVVASSGIYNYNSQSNKLILSKKLNLLDEACFINFEGRTFCGNSAGLFLFNSGENQWTEVKQYVSGIDNIHVRVMRVTSQNELLIGTSKGLFKYNSNLELLESDIGNDQRYHNINGIAEDSTGTIWISTFSNLYSKNSKGKNLKDFHHLFLDKRIRSLVRDVNQRLWVGGEFGIIILDPETGKTKEVYRDVSYGHGLNDNAVYSFYRDQADNIWVGTYFGGINLWSTTFDTFTIYFPGKGKKNLSGKVVRDIQEDEYGNLWLALEDGGLNYLNPVTGNVKHFFIQKENEYKNIHSIILDKEQIWIGSFNSGLECYGIIRINNEPFLTKKASYLIDKMIFAISRSSDQKIFAGSSGNIFILDTRNGKIETFNEEVFKNRIIYTIKRLSDHVILAGTLRNGLYYFDTQRKISIAFTRDENKRIMQTISSIGKIDSTHYSITSSTGLHIFNSKDKSLKNILKSEEDIEFRSVLIDDQGDYWISSTKGLIYKSADQKVTKFYNMYDGLPENQFNFNSAFKSSEGKMYFGTYNGLISFYPEKLKSFQNEIPEVSFTAYTVLDEDRVTLTSHYLDKKTKELRLKPFQKFLSLEFSALGYTRTKDVNYEISIIGENVNWDKLKNSRSVTLTNLSKGWHQLEVRCVNEENIAGPSTLLNIYRQPAIWQTAYAYLIYAGILILIILLIRKDFLRRHKEKNTLALERYEKEQQKKLNDQKMRFFLNISHEFRTPLTIIGGTIANIKNKFTIDKDLSLKLDTIQNTSFNLNKLVNDFLDYESLDSGYKALEMNRQPVLPFVEHACNMFDNWAETNRLTYLKNIEANVESGLFDSHKVERIIYNLLSNAFKFNKNNGTVKVEARLRKEMGTWLDITVNDDGIGISPKLLASIKKKFENAGERMGNDKSIGLSYTAGLVHQMSGRISVESKAGKGSKFSVEIPILIMDFSEKTTFEVETTKIDSYTNSNEIVSLIRKEKKASILLIDDNIELLNMLKETLEEIYNITPVSSPKESLSIVLRKDYSLIICDIIMSEMHGFEVIEALQSNLLTSHIPVLILTAAADKDIEIKAYKKGAVSYLAKPFKIEELKAKIESILSLRQHLISRYRNEHDLSLEEVVSSDKDKDFLQKAVALVQANMDNIEFDVEMFHSGMNMSRTLLYTKLKNITGMSTAEFIRGQRLKQAYIYLKRSDMSISEVAFKCGFNDANYFSRSFKKVYKVFPSKIKG